MLLDHQSNSDQNINNGKVQEGEAANQSLVTNTNVIHLQNPSKSVR